MSRIKVAIIFGGRSTEHAISLLSAQNIVANLDRTKYDPVLIAIDEKGRWHYQGNELKIKGGKDPKKVALDDNSQAILFSQNTNEHYIVASDDVSSLSLATMDVIWPVLHGTFGEDGSIQGLAKLANLPCVGPGILSSAIGMDKEVMKRILRDEGISSAKWISLRRKDQYRYSYEEVKERLGAEIFVKPVNLGSSVGISFVKEERDFQKAIDYAFLFDNKVLLEERVIGREIECGVLGNDNPVASIPGEVIPDDGFYSYESKYIDESGARLMIPAEMSTEELEKVQSLARRTFIALECQGMARVDMFLTSSGELLINEINTLPGFTDVSMYPMLFAQSGVSNKELVDRLIELAIENHAIYSSLKTKV